jgi:hypothetical protein
MCRILSNISLSRNTDTKRKILRTEKSANPFGTHYEQVSLHVFVSDGKGIGAFHGEILHTITET